MPPHNYATSSYRTFYFSSVIENPDSTPYIILSQEQAGESCESCFIDNPITQEEFTKLIQQKEEPVVTEDYGLTYDDIVKGAFCEHT